MAVGSRREARESALSLLYEAESKGVRPVEVLADLPVPPDPFAAERVEGVDLHAERIDGLISQFAVGWPLERMAALDRAVLRLATYELLERADTPVGAILDEAVELAKTFSTEDSGRFVNGVLAAVAAEQTSSPRID